MTARIITNTGIEELTDTEFANRLGIRIRTKAESQAEWRAECERFATAIEDGFEALVPPPCLADSRAIVEERRLQKQVAQELSFTIENEKRKRAA